MCKQHRFTHVISPKFCCQPFFAAFGNIPGYAITIICPKANRARLLFGLRIVKETTFKARAFRFGRIATFYMRSENLHNPNRKGEEESCQSMGAVAAFSLASHVFVKGVGQINSNVMRALIIDRSQIQKHTVLRKLI